MQKNRYLIYATSSRPNYSENNRKLNFSPLKKNLVQIIKVQKQLNQETIFPWLLPMQNVTIIHSNLKEKQELKLSFFLFTRISDSNSGKISKHKNWCDQEKQEHSNSEQCKDERKNSLFNKLIHQVNDKDKLSVSPQVMKIKNKEKNEIQFQELTDQKSQTKKLVVIKQNLLKVNKERQCEKLYFRFQMNLEAQKFKSKRQNQKSLNQVLNPSLHQQKNQLNPQEILNSYLSNKSSKQNQQSIQIFTKAQ